MPGGAGRRYSTLVISSVILLIPGLASFYFLFVVQNYHVLNPTLKSMKTFPTNVVENLPNRSILLVKGGRITTINQKAANLSALNYDDIKGNFDTD